MPTTAGGPGGGATEAQVVAYITQKWGAAKAAAFQKWYAAALARDPHLTPSAGAEIWILGTGLSTGLGKIGTFTAVQVPTAAAGSAAGAVAKTDNLITAPLKGIDAIGAFFIALTQRNTWTRILKVAFGGVLLIAGIVKMTGATDKLAGLGPVGMAVSKVPGV